MDLEKNTRGSRDQQSSADPPERGDGHRVAAIRQILDYLGYFPGAVEGAAIDGAIDGAVDGATRGDTRRALRAFQHQHGLPETGVVDQPVMRFFQHVRVPAAGPIVVPGVMQKARPAGATAAPQGDPVEADFGANELVYTAGLDAHERGDHKTARQHWVIAAEGGHKEAQYRMGVLFDHGEGVVADAVSAAFWYGRAAENGHVRAQTNIGVMYRQGDGVKKDSQTALIWTERAARQGVARAQTNLALMLAGGEGSPVDYVQAYMWFATAAAQGNADARKGMTALASLMTFSQLTEAKSLAKTFRAEAEDGA